MKQTKQIKLYLLGIFLIGIIVAACKKNDLSSAKDSNNNKLEKFLTGPDGELVPVDPNKPITLQEMELFAEYDFSTTPMPTTEAEAAIQLAPLMENSRQYFYDVGLTSADLLEEFSSLDDYHIAYVAFQLKAIDLQGGGIPGCDSNIKAVRCLVQSLIPCSLLDLFNGQARDLLINVGFKAAFNSLSYSAKKTVVKVLATRAGQMFGGAGIGLALFTYDFALCMFSGGGVSDIQNRPDIPAGGIERNDLIDVNSPLKFPDNYSKYVYYTKYYTHIGPYTGSSSSNVPMPVTHVFYNIADQKYYMDSSFTKILPDGFYMLEDDMTNNMSNKYREVLNGQVVLIAYVKDIDTYRALEVFDPITHQPFMP